MATPKPIGQPSKPAAATSPANEPVDEATQLAQKLANDGFLDLLDHFYDGAVLQVETDTKPRIGLVQQMGDSHYYPLSPELHEELLRRGMLRRVKLERFIPSEFGHRVLARLHTLWVQKEAVRTRGS